MRTKRAFLSLTALGLSACTGVIAGGESPPGAPEASGEPSSPERPPLDPREPVRCEEAQARPLEARIWRLGEAQWRASAEALVGIEGVASELGPDAVGEAFPGEVHALRVRDAEVGALWRDARRVAERAAAEGFFLTRFPCLETPDASCAEELVRGLGRDAFRRPLDDDEVARYQELFEVAQRELGEGPEAVLQAMLQSPNLVYRSELGPAGGSGVVSLTPHELAAALSYALTDAPPDAALAALADADGLDADAVHGVALRLAADPRWQEKKVRFVRQWLELDHLGSVEKGDAYPEFDALRTAFDAELEALLGRAAAEGRIDLALLFDTQEGIEDPVLAAHYGVEDAQTLPRSRRGLMTRGAFLATHSGREITSPVTRGYVLRTRLLCDPIPDPPEGVNTALPSPPENASHREHVDAVTLGGSCATCHGRMNDLGFAFGAYDPVGALREIDDYGMPLDLSGELRETTDADGSFADLDALLDRLRGSRQVEECMARQTFRFVGGRDPSTTDACALHAMLEAGGDDVSFDAMVRALLISPDFDKREVMQ